MAIPALVVLVAAKVGLSRESDDVVSRRVQALHNGRYGSKQGQSVPGSIPPATIKTSDIRRGTWSRNRIHCMRLPLGPEIMFNMLAVDMNSGVKLISVRIATPLSRLVFDADAGGNMEVAAKSSDT